MSTTLVQQTDTSPADPAGASSKKPQPSLAVIAIVCLILSGLFRWATGLDAEGAKFRPSEQGVSKVVGGEWLAGMLLGFREAVADMMWIQVDAYFHEGRYDKILPICYIITTLDPGWIQVYTTGAWHLGYNFGDRRLVPTAIDFDRRGVENNPDSNEMWYELGWMELSRGYNFKEAAIDFKKSIDLGLPVVGQRHAWAHAVESSGDVDGAIRAWKYLEELAKKDNQPDPVPPKWVHMLNLRQVARQDLGKKPILVHMDVKVTRTGPRVLHVEGVVNLPKLSKVYVELRDSDWQQKEKETLGEQMQNYTLYSQRETTLRPSWGLFRGQQIDFDRGTLKIHSGIDSDLSPDHLAAEVPMPLQNGHMVVQNGYFSGDIDMAREPDQYPLKAASYDFRIVVDPRIEPITTQDVIGWNGEGIAGPQVQKINGYNQVVWSHTLSKSDIVGPNGS